MHGLRGPSYHANGYLRDVRGPGVGAIVGIAGPKIAVAIQVPGVYRNRVRQLPRGRRRGVQKPVWPDNSAHRYLDGAFVDGGHLSRIPSGNSWRLVALLGASRYPEESLCC